jgi:hypothetical protein
MPSKATRKKLKRKQQQQQPQRKTLETLSETTAASSEGTHSSFTPDSRPATGDTAENGATSQLNMKSLSSSTLKTLDMLRHSLSQVSQEDLDTLEELCSEFTTLLGSSVAQSFQLKASSNLNRKERGAKASQSKGKRKKHDLDALKVSSNFRTQSLQYLNELEHIISEASGEELEMVEQALAQVASTVVDTTESQNLETALTMDWEQRRAAVPQQKRGEERN